MTCAFASILKAKAKDETNWAALARDLQSGQGTILDELHTMRDQMSLLLSATVGSGGGGGGGGILGNNAAEAVAPPAYTASTFHAFCTATFPSTLTCVVPVLFTFKGPHLQARSRVLEGWRRRMPNRRSVPSNPRHRRLHVQRRACPAIPTTHAASAASAASARWRPLRRPQQGSMPR